MVVPVLVWGLGQFVGESVGRAYSGVLNFKYQSLQILSSCCWRSPVQRHFPQQVLVHRLVASEAKPFGGSQLVVFCVCSARATSVCGTCCCYTSPGHCCSRQDVELAFRGAPGPTWTPHWVSAFDCTVACGSDCGRRPGVASQTKNK